MRTALDSGELAKLLAVAFAVCAVDACLPFEITRAFAELADGSSRIDCHGASSGRVSHRVSHVCHMDCGSNSNSRVCQLVSTLPNLKMSAGYAAYLWDV